MLKYDLLTKVVVEPLGQLGEQHLYCRRLDLEPLQSSVEVVPLGGVADELVDLLRQVGTVDHVPDDGLFIYVDFPGPLVLVVLGGNYLRGPQNTRSEPRLKLRHLFTSKFEFGLDHCVRVGLMAPLVSDVTLPRVVHDVELAVGAPDWIQPSQRLQKGRLSGLVLADQGSDVVQGDPPGVVNAAIISNLGSSYVHYASSVLAARYLTSSLNSIDLDSVWRTAPRRPSSFYSLCHEEECSL